MKHLRIKTKLFQRAALMMLTLVMAFTAQTAWADYGWYDASLIIGGVTTDPTTWSNDGNNPTDLGIVTDMTITQIEFNVWDDANDRGGANMYFRIWDGGTSKIGSDVDLWLGSTTRIEGKTHDFSISFNTSTNLATEVGLSLDRGRTYFIDMYAKTYGDSGDHWYNNGGNDVNYHAKLTIAPPDNYSLTAKLAGDAYWCTFCINGNYKPTTEGTQVFAVNFSGTTLTMTEIEGGIVKDGQGVVLKNKNTSSITMTKTNETASFDFSTYNSLVGTTAKKVFNNEDNNWYVLNNGDNGLGFYKLSKNGTIEANKAYLTYSGGVGAREFIGFDDDATRIEMPMVESSDADAVVYDLQGRRVAQPTKGLYIVNGKKVIIK